MWVDAVDPRFAEFRAVTVEASRDPRVRQLAFHLAGMYDPRPSPALARFIANASVRELRLYQARRLLRAVQDRVTYVEQPRVVHPLATWSNRGGDCKSSATLLASLALAMGIPARLMALGFDGEPEHLACQLAPDGAWLWAETTLHGAELGEHPSDALERLGDGGNDRADLGGVHGVIGEQQTHVTVLAATHAAARDILERAYYRVLQRAPSTFERIIVQALCYGETQYGRGWTRPCPPSSGGLVGELGDYAQTVLGALGLPQEPAPCANSHNWGGIHATGDQPSCSCSDSLPDGARYDQPMAVYPDDDAGAAAVLQLIYGHMQGVARELERGSSIEAVARALFFSHYYGAYCPNAIERYGDAAKHSFAFPAWAASERAAGRDGHATTPAGRACESEEIAQWTDKTARIAKEIATLLGEPVPPRGGSSVLPWLFAGGVIAGGVIIARKRRKKRSS